MDKNNLLLIQLDQLIKKQFANIGDIIGDCLMSIEVNRALIIVVRQVF
jgi:citrate lyase gamma subunit